MLEVVTSDIKASHNRVISEPNTGWGSKISLCAMLKDVNLIPLIKRGSKNVIE